MDYAAALHSVSGRAAICWPGAQADADDFSNSLNDGWLQVPGNSAKATPRGRTISQHLPRRPTPPFGELVQGTRTALLGLMPLRSTTLARSRTTGRGAHRAAAFIMRCSVRLPGGQRGAACPRTAQQKLRLRGDRTSRRPAHARRLALVQQVQRTILRSWAAARARPAAITRVPTAAPMNLIIHRYPAPVCWD